jgi:hypothetical protein
MARTATKWKKSRWVWRRVVKPTGKWALGRVVLPGIKGGGRSLKVTWKAARHVEEREKALDRLAKRVEGRRPVGWAKRDVNAYDPEWIEVRGRRRRRKNAGTFHCLKCGGTENLSTGSAHKCPTKPVKASKPMPTAPPKRPRKTGPAAKPLPSVKNPTRGARIVRANTAAERFAHLPTADPSTAAEFEAVVHDIAAGFLRLSQEIHDFGETVDVDPRVKATLYKLAGEVAELFESGRDVRRVFRIVYAAHFAAADTGAKVPKNPDYFAS